MHPNLLKGISRYRRKSAALATIELLATLIPGAVFYGCGLAAARAGSHGLMLSCAVIAGVFVVRLFMIQHDCGHASFFPSKRANNVLGFVIGVVTLTPYQCWRRFHAMHHAHSGNLDGRNVGDIRTLTVAEYTRLPAMKRFFYRLYRNPLVLFGLGPVLIFFIRQRLTYYIPKKWKTERMSVHATNACLAVILGLIAASGALPVFLRFHVPVMLVATFMGVWLFYVQHQFPDSYWKRKHEWRHAHAAMSGSSHYDLPPVVRWLTANIGLHHIHHLDSSIPSYNLNKCLRGHLALHSAKRFGFVESLSYPGLKLWDEERETMTRFPSGGERAAFSRFPV